MDANSLTKGEDGRIHAQAVTSFDSETKAREHLGKSSGLALYSDRNVAGSRTAIFIELWSDASMLERWRHEPKTVEQRLDQADWSRGRDGEHFIVAKWDDVLRNPGIGQRASRVGGTPTRPTASPRTSGPGPSAGRTTASGTRRSGCSSRRTPEVWTGDDSSDFGGQERDEGRTPEAGGDSAGGGPGLGAAGSFGMDRNQFKQDQSM